MRESGKYYAGRRGLSIRQRGLQFSRVAAQGNGDVFLSARLNWTLSRHLQECTKPARVTRPRPHHKDDNVHVEQKNWMWPRQLLSYVRLENPGAVQLINALFKDAWSRCKTFFCPA